MTHQRQPSGLRADNRSGFRGVCWHAQLGAWRAQIVADGRARHLGLFATAEAAANAYDQAALELFGPDAWTNHNNAPKEHP